MDLIIVVTHFCCHRPVLFINTCSKLRSNSFHFRHKSKFKSTVKDDYTTNKAAYKTMGQAKVPTRAPDDYMKKREREPVLPESKLDHSHLNFYSIINHVNLF